MKHTIKWIITVVGTLIASFGALIPLTNKHQELIDQGALLGIVDPYLIMAESVQFFITLILVGMAFMWILDLEI